MLGFRSGTRCRDEDKKRQRACGTEKERAVSALLEQANNDAASQCGVRFGVGPTGAPTGFLRRRPSTRPERGVQQGS
ncbi:hypothetical protein CapIbe_008677 [Capra ibex]